MDADISRWVLEFLICQPRVDDSVAKLAVSVLPLPDGDPLFMKAILLRSIQSEIDEALISEKLLASIEVMEEIDRSAGVPVTEFMKEAYCMVAVECSIRYIHGGRLEKQRKFVEAVGRIWTGRIRAMVKSAIKSELLTEKLMQWGHRIEGAISDQSECLNLMMINSRADAYRAIRAYVTDALDKLRPSFLETVAARHGKDASDELLLADDGMESPGQADVRNSQQERSTPPELAKEAEIDMTEKLEPAREPVEIHELHGINRPRRFKRKKGGPMIRDIEESMSETMCTDYDIISSADVKKLQNALKSSSFELHAMVEDPLPDALRVAGSVASAIAEHSAQDPIREIPSTQNANKKVEPNPVIMGNNCPNESLNHQNDVRRPTLMERNSSARTDKWEDSIDDSLEELTSDDAERPMLASRRRKAVSPLRMPQAAKLCRRRKKKRWSTEEEDALRSGVQRFGKGNWKLILNSYRSVFDERTEVDLKDKWRNLTRTGNPLLH